MPKSAKNNSRSDPPRHSAPLPAKLRVLVVSSEASPFAKTGGLADVAGSLPEALRKLGCETALCMPLYRSVSPDRFALKLEAKDVQVPMGMGDVDANILSCSWGGQGTAYFIQNARYFNRDGLYGGAQGDYPDNAERFAFFCRAVLEALKVLNWFPHVIHLNDWQTGLVAAYLKTAYRGDPRYADIRTLFTIHNMAFQGVFPKYVLPMTGIGWEEFLPEKLEFYDQVNYLKAGLVYSDALSTVSERHAQEIQTEEFGHGLQGVLKSRAKDLRGILNGLNYGEWNPATDKEIPAQYTVKNHEKKLESKKKLLQEQKLEFKPGTPLLGMVTRLTSQKGLDLVGAVAEEFLAMDVQCVVLGTGEPKYQSLLEGLQQRHPGKLAVQFRFDTRLAKLIYAGSDLFLMPSQFEPCGLSQLVSLKYGTIPIVRKTGGLADTVENLSPDGKNGTGFVFEDYRGEELLFALRRALEAFHQPKLWKGLMERAMRQDYSWDVSARKYLELYKNLLSENR